VLVLNSASSDGVRYWQRSAVHARWLGRGAGLLGIEVAQGSPCSGRAPSFDAHADAVNGTDLRNLLAGLGRDGTVLTTRPRQRRRQGWDLVFAAPKSVSLLAMAGNEELSQTVRGAFHGAVSDAFGVLEDNAAWVVQGGLAVRAGAVVAAAFEHVDNNAGQPHLHCHVVLANLASREDGLWGCLIGRELWRWREGVGASFQMSLRSRLSGSGLCFDWEIGPGGLGEIAGLAGPRARASSRALAARAGAAWFGSPSAATARVAQGRGRQGMAGSRRTGPVHQAGTEGIGPEDAGRLALSAKQHPGAAVPPPPPSEHAVASLLAERGSSFGEPEVLVALAETSAAGLSVQEATAWARNFCASNQPLPTSSDRGGNWAPRQRWTTGLAGHVDGQVSSWAMEGRFAHLAEVPFSLASRELEALGMAGPVAGVALQLVCSGAAVEAIPRAPWLVQAGCLDAARAAWQSGGVSVQVMSPTAASEGRWRALTSLRPPARREGSEKGAPGRRVLVVDAADHLGPAALARLVAQAAAARTKLVLVAGGTVPGRGESMARSLDELLAAGQALPGPELTVTGLFTGLSTRLSTGSAAPAACSPEVSVPGLPVRGCFTGGETTAHLVAAWHAVQASGAPALMVAFGAPEAEALNLAARRASGLEDTPQSVDFGERRYSIGERVIALRRIGEVPAATIGTISATAEGSVNVRWGSYGTGIRSTVGREHASDIGYGYATTPPYLRRSGSGMRLLVLGDPTYLAQLGGAVTQAWVTVGGPNVPVLQPGNSAVRWRSAIAELATGWPDEQMLQRAGPRPLAGASLRRWEQSVTASAFERCYGLTPALPEPSILPEPGRGLFLGAPGERSSVPRAPRLGRGAPGL
jgi:conjugative relaxase-like TrwC/TraI family protein